MSEFLLPLFKTVLTMSFTVLTTGVIIAIWGNAIVRLLRLPQWAYLILLGFVFFRAVCPFPAESRYSLYNYRPFGSRNDQQIVEMFGQQPVGKDRYTHVLPGEPDWSQIPDDPDAIVEAPYVPGSQPQAVSPVDRLKPQTVETVWYPRLAVVWVAGMAALAGWTLVSWLRLKRKLAAAVRTADGAWESDRIDAPFVLGVFRPKIYLPLGLEGDERQWVLRHEQAHIRRGDPVWKLLAFGVVILHWFNPAIWLDWGEFCRTMELACDEAVLRQTGERKAYSSALLALASKRPVRMPLAFSEGDVKTRIARVLRWQKPAQWAAPAAIVLAMVTGVGLATGPIRLPDEVPTATVSTPFAGSIEAGQFYRATSPVPSAVKTYLPIPWEKAPIVDAPHRPTVDLTFDGPAPDKLEAVGYALDETGEELNMDELYITASQHGGEENRYLLRIPAPALENGRGTVQIGVQVEATWGVGTNTKVQRYGFRLFTFADPAEGLRTAPSAIVAGQELPLTEVVPDSGQTVPVSNVTANWGEMLSVVAPKDGAVEYLDTLYAIDPDGTWRFLSASGSTPGGTHGHGLTTTKEVGEDWGVELRYTYEDGSVRVWRGAFRVQKQDG